MIQSMLISALSGAIAGAAALWFLFASPRVELAETNAKTAAEQVTAANTSLDRCKADLTASEAALGNLRQQGELRAAIAKKALDAAAAAAAATGEAVQQILAERTPPGVDACAAARSAFDAELRRERAK